MARQARAELTRRRIIDAAVDAFGEVGYMGAMLGDVVDRADITKGALYHHFESKEALAWTIIEEGTERGLAAFRRMCESAAPAVENMVRGVLAAGELADRDKMVAVTGKLLRSVGEFDPAASHVYKRWLEAIVSQVSRVRAEGDLRDGLDPALAGEALTGAVIGSALLANETVGPGARAGQLTRLWEFLLPALVKEHTVPRLREFLDRESARVSRGI